LKTRFSGSRAERSGLAKAKEALREGDTLVIWKLDRLGRSVKHLVDLVEKLREQGVQFKGSVARIVQAARCWGGSTGKEPKASMPTSV